MADDDSFSSTTSTMSYHSHNGDDSSSEINTSQYTTTSSSSFDATDIHEDSNLDNLTDILADEIAKSRTGLYEIKVDIKIDLPKENIFNKPDLVRATVYTICGEIFFKYPQWRSVASEIVFQLGKSLSPTTSIWHSVRVQKFMYHGKTKISGHLICVDQRPDLPIVMDTFRFSNFICATYICLEYTVEVFLSPGIAGVKEFYDSHGFKTLLDGCAYKQKYMEDVLQAQENLAEEKFNHHLAWATVYNVLNDYRQNIAKQNQFFEEYGFAF